MEGQITEAYSLVSRGGHSFRCRVLPAAEHLSDTVAQVESLFQTCVHHVRWRQ